MLSLKDFKALKVEPTNLIFGGANHYSKSKESGSTVDVCTNDPRDEFDCRDEYDDNVLWG